MTEQIYPSQTSSGANYRYIKELNYFNATACLLVIFIHVSAIGVSELRMGSWQQFFIYMPWRLSSFVVPAFLFSGAVKMARMFSMPVKIMPSYTQYIKERCKNILLPYLIFSGIYFILLGLSGLLPLNAETLLRGIFTGDISGQFYYIIIVMQFYLLQPFWKHIVNKTPLWTGLPVSLFITMASLKLPSLLCQACELTTYIDRFCLLYTFFWVIGLYTGKFYDCLYDSIIKNKYSVFLTVILILAATVINQLQLLNRNFIFEMDFFKLLTDTFSIFILLTACILLERKQDNVSLKLKALLDRINKASYFVYLAHCLFITLITFYLQISGFTDITMLLLIRTAAAYTLPFLLYYLWQKCKALIKIIIRF